MLFTEWDMDKALAISKEEGYEDGREDGEESKQQELIRAFSDVLEPEVIAEKVHKSVEYVRRVLDAVPHVSEDSVPYEVGKKE